MRFAGPRSGRSSILPSNVRSPAFGSAVKRALTAAVQRTQSCATGRQAQEDAPARCSDDLHQDVHSQLHQSFFRFRDRRGGGTRVRQCNAGPVNNPGWSNLPCPTAVPSSRLQCSEPSWRIRRTGKPCRTLASSTALPPSAMPRCGRGPSSPRPSQRRRKGFGQPTTSGCA